LAAILSGQTKQAAGAARPPNIVYILTDDLGWRDLHCYGCEQVSTPNIDRLAAQGMMFTEAYAACTVCSPTRASIMTGKYPARLHLTDYIPGRPQSNTKLLLPDWTKTLAAEETTIAQTLRQAGYVTAIVGKWHLGCEAAERGFDKVLVKTGSSPQKNSPLLTEKQTDAALQFIEENKERPFFCYLAYNAVHTPLSPRTELLKKYRSEKARDSKPTAEYLSVVEEMDNGVGRVLKKLDESGLSENTIVFFMSDNGGLILKTNNKPLREGKGWPYEGGIRVPQIVRWPGVIKAGSTCAVPTSSVDHYATLIDLAGVKDVKGHNTDGVSLSPLLRQTGNLNRDAIYWHYPHYHAGKPSSAVRAGDWKLIEFLENNNIELYNLKEDAEETKNLAATLPEKAAELRRMLHRWRNSVGAQMMKLNPEFKPEIQK
jgi:arylsulfatase A-like enzyme